MEALRKIKLPRFVLPLSIVGTGVGLVVLVKDNSRGVSYKGEERIVGRTVLITGTTSGLGKATAMELAKRGGKILMGCRDLKKCEEVRQEIIEATFNRNVHCKKLDLASLKSIRECAKDINQNEKRLDILINNAGVMACPKSLTEDGFEMQLGVNHLGHFLLTNLLLDKLKQCAPGRIITVSSIAATTTSVNFKNLNSTHSYNKTLAYSQSKLANVLFTLELSKRLQGTGVTANTVYPGVVLTNIGRHLGMNQSYISSAIIGPFWKLTMKEPELGIQTILYSVLDPSLTDKSGTFLRECGEMKLEGQATDEAAAKRLWLISEKWTKLETDQ